MKRPADVYDLYMSLARSDELKQHGLAYLKETKDLPMAVDVAEEAADRKKKILEILRGHEEDWSNWKWQLKNRVNDTQVLGKIIGLSNLEKKRIDRVSKAYRWAISPYYLSLIGEDYKEDPIFKQSVPNIMELFPGGSLDPMNEAHTSPAPCVTRRYPDRMIINVTNQCAMYCRHCQRRRNIGEIDQHACWEDIHSALDYVEKNREIRDVLVTGGDALMLSNQLLDFILARLQNIPHVEIKRLGTRVPVTLPQRITPEVCDILRHYPPIYINTQFNHPREITPDSKQACDALIGAGAVLGNQAVLLKGINDKPHIMRKLNHDLLKIRVRPYYIFHAKDVKGTKHFRTSISTGLDIMKSMRGYTSGIAIPTYILNAPGGLGKIPLMPNHIMEVSRAKVVLKTWEGQVVEVENEVT
ncbi:MAG: glutamate 2,3-aminomutase [Syntrophomonadaceae bacterium]|nr:glutamate 2,3-aminomutase [Syntrophomonadaceae bacterium]